MNVITFRQLQRMTVKELQEATPVTVTVDGKDEFIVCLTSSDSQKDTMTVKEEVRVIDDPTSNDPFKNYPQRVSTRVNVSKRKIVNGMCQHGVSEYGICKRCNEV